MMNARLQQLMGYWIIGLLVLGGLTGLSLVFEEASAYSVRGTIRIEGDANFTLGNGVSAGSGTELDPYIIDGWEIDGGGVGRCIYVGNTTKHFVIRNCNLTNSSGNNALYYRNAGISLYNVTNFVIENCTISGNGYGIYLDSASGFTITGSHFEDNGYGIYLSIDGTGLDRDFTILEMIVKDNDFKMTTNNRAVYFDIDLCYGFNGPHDVKIGNITVTGNEMFMNGTSAYGIDIDSLDVYELEDGNITIGNVNISDNRIFGGNFGIDFYGNLYDYTNVTLKVGDVIFNGNVILNQTSYSIYLDYYDAEYMYGDTTVTMGDIVMNGNTLISHQTDVNAVYLSDYAYWEYYEDEASLTTGDIFVEGNLIDVDDYGIYIDYAYGAYDFEGESSVVMGNCSIRNNTMLNSSYGVYLDIEEFDDMIDNSSAIMGDIVISNNYVNSTDAGIYLYYYYIAYDMYNNASVTLGDVTIFDNQVISSGAEGIYFEYDEIGYYMKDNSMMEMGETSIFNNQIDSSSDAIYFYFEDYTAYELFNDTKVIIGNVTVDNNTMSSPSDDGLYIEYGDYYMSSCMEHDSYARLPSIFITGNTFDVGGDGIYYYTYSNPDDNYDNATAEWGELFIDGNTFTDCTYGVYLYYEDVAEDGYDSSIITIDDITVTNNEFDNLSDDGIYIYLDDIGYSFDDSGVVTMGDILIEGNDIDGCDDGIYVDGSFFYSDYSARVTIGDFWILDNVVRNCTYRGIYATYDLDADANSNLTVGNITISGNDIANCGSDGIYLYNFIEEEPDATAVMGVADINNNTITNSTGAGRAGIFLDKVGNATISDNFLTECHHGIYLLEAHDTRIYRTIARSNRNSGLFVKDNDRLEVELSSFTQNLYGVFIDPSEDAEIHNSSIHDNSEFGVNATDNGGLLVDATGNWWGHGSGPANAVNNSAGQGDNVTDFVNMTGWLSAPILFITSSDEVTTPEDEPYSVRYEAFDADGLAPNWSLNTSAGWLSLDPVTGVLSGTPGNSEVGDHVINVSVENGYGGMDWSNFILTVTNVNDAPAIVTDDVITTPEDTPYNVDYEAVDIDPVNDTLTWYLDADAAWLSMNSTEGVLSGTPGNGDLGAWGINVSVSDGKGGLDWHNFTLTVTNVNDAPGITTEAVTNATEDELYSVDHEAADIDPTNDTLNWSLETEAGWLSINSSSGVLSGTPVNADVGAYRVNVTCTDGNGGSDLLNFTLTVINVNDAPVITTSHDVNTTQNELYSVDYEAVDVDPTDDVLRWKVESDAGWLSMNRTSGVLSGTPKDAGKYWVNVTVEDGNGGADSRNFTLTVIANNSAPSITTAALPQATEGEPFTHKLQFSDPDGDAVAWEMRTNANWLSINGTTGMLSGTPPVGSNGDYWVNISLTDGNGGTHHYNFTLSVLEKETPDIIGIIDVRDGEIKNLTFTDVSGIVLKLTVSGNGTLTAIRAGEDSGSVGVDPEGYFRISFLLDLTFEGDMAWTNITFSFADITLNDSRDYSLATIFFYDGNQWRSTESTGANAEEGLVWANVTHFTIFAGFAPLKKDDGEVPEPGEEGEAEPWYKGTGAMVGLISILVIVVLLGVFLYMRSKADAEKKPEEKAPAKKAYEGEEGEGGPSKKTGKKDKKKADKEKDGKEKDGKEKDGKEKDGKEKDGKEKDGKEKDGKEKGKEEIDEHEGEDDVDEWATDEDLEEALAEFDEEDEFDELDLDEDMDEIEEVPEEPDDEVDIEEVPEEPDDEVDIEEVPEEPDDEVDIEELKEPDEEFSYEIPGETTGEGEEERDGDEDIERELAEFGEEEEPDLPAPDDEPDIPVLKTI